MTVRALISGALVALLASVGLTACGGGASSSEQAANKVGTGTHQTGDLLSKEGIKEGGTLKVGFAGPLVEMDPQKSQSLEDQQQLENIYRGLTRPKSASDPVPVGEIAKSWKVSKDELTWTFQLRPGIKFQDGQPLTSADVVYSIERIMNPETAATAASEFEPVKKVEAVGPMTVRFTLKQPYSLLPEALDAPAWAAIIPKGSGPTIASHPDGTGPFEYVSQVKNTSLTLKRFAGFWKQGQPKLEGVEFIYLPDANARVNALKTGQVDFITSVPLEQTAALQADKSVSVAKFDTSFVDEFGFNTKQKPFDDVKVRQAIAHALNKEDITKVATFGLGQPSATMVAPTSPVKVEAPELEFNQAESKKLLKEAGVTNLSIGFSPCGGESFPEMRRAGEVIVGELGEVGIKAHLEELESSVWAENVITKHNYDAFICGLLAGNDPDGHSYRYFTKEGAFNFSQYEGPEKLNELLAEGREVSDPAERSKIYGEAWTIINKEAPWIPLFSVPSVVAAGSTVRGFEPFPEFNLRFETVGFAG
jgi:ABC-type transport system substrate-binding protein